MTNNNGGPAFPSKEIESKISALQAGKIPYEISHSGMTLRDYLAGQALMGYFLDPNLDMPRENVAKQCYLMADAMLLERDK